MAQHESAVDSASTTGVSHPGTVPEWAFVERPPIDIEAWKWDHDVQEARRLLKTFGANREVHADHSSVPPPPTWSRRSEREPGRQPPASRPARRRPAGVAFLSWSALSLGVMALVFGGVLLGWSYWSGRQQLWSLGLPFALGGQAAMILGLVLQIDGVWQNSREAATALNQLDEQMDELRHTTTMLTSSHNSHAKSFYFHLAEGASPHMLLADLKGQLDLLALRMSKDSGS